MAWTQGTLPVEVSQRLTCVRHPPRGAFDAQGPAGFTHHRSKTPHLPHGPREGFDASCTFGGKKLSVLFSQVNHHRCRLKDALLRCHYVSVLDLADAQLQETLDWMERNRVEHVWGFPNSIYFLAKCALQRGWNVPLQSVITWGDTRATAIARMQNALNEMVVDGIKTNILLHREIFQHAAFKTGGTDIDYLEKRLGL